MHHDASCATGAWVRHRKAPSRGVWQVNHVGSSDLFWGAALKQKGIYKTSGSGPAARHASLTKRGPRHRGWEQTSSRGKTHSRRARACAVTRPPASSVRPTLAVQGVQTSQTLLQPWLLEQQQQQLRLPGAADGPALGSVAVQVGLYRIVEFTTRLALSVMQGPLCTGASMRRLGVLPQWRRARGDGTAAAAEEEAAGAAPDAASVQEARAGGGGRSTRAAAKRQQSASQVRCANATCAPCMASNEAAMRRPAWWTHCGSQVTALPTTRAWLREAPSCHVRVCDTRATCACRRRRPPPLPGPRATAARSQRPRRALPSARAAPRWRSPTAQSPPRSRRRSRRRRRHEAAAPGRPKPPPQLQQQPAALAAAAVRPRPRSPRRPAPRAAASTPAREGRAAALATRPRCRGAPPPRSRARPTSGGPAAPPAPPQRAAVRERPRGRTPRQGTAHRLSRRARRAAPPARSRGRRSRGRRRQRRRGRR
jgi:hypothetical protein